MKYTSINGQIFMEMLLSGAYELENKKEEVNRLNVFPVPDGDTGTNMSATIMSAVSEIKNVKQPNVSSIANAAAMGALMGARGNSGVILSQLFRGISKYLKGKQEMTTEDFSQALNEGTHAAYRAVMKPTEGTILTVARESSAFAIEIAKNEDDFTIFMEKVYEQAVISLNKTPNLLPVLKQAGVVDAGGKGLAEIYFGILQRLKESKIELNEKNDNQIENQQTTINYEQIDTSNIKFGYCTEFFIKTNNADIEKFKKVIMKYGDSIVVVGTEKLIKTHIHTNEPGTVLQEALKLGELGKVKIDNMRDQHRSIINEVDASSADEQEHLDKMIEQEENNSSEEQLPKKNYGIIAVAMGEGIKDIFNNLGVDYVIEGGQTMNPSTHDILNAINKINSNNIIIMPNNGNIIMAAQQARDVSEKNVLVIPSKSIPQGISGVIAFNPEASLEENEKNIIEAISNVKTGQITYAVRNTTFDGKEIKEGNILGMVNGKLVEVGETIEIVSEKILDSMVESDSELITILYGSDVKQDDTAAFLKYSNEKYKGCDTSLNYGGQPLYYYIISVE